MDISAVGLNPVLSDYIKSNSYLSSSQKIISQDNFNNSVNTSTQDEKIAVITGKIDLSNIAYSFRYQSGAPVSQPESSVRSYNEKRKVAEEKSKYTSTNSETSNDASAYESDETIVNNRQVGVGTYLVMSSFSSSKQSKSESSPETAFNDKLRKTYQVGYRKSPGTLVNLLF